MIQFANPSALWLLTLLIPLILLYLLKQKRQEVVVASTLLWKKTLEDLHARTPFQKLRSNLLLFLQILAVVLITALLAKPYLQAQPRSSSRVILVLDTSASMSATDESPNRFAVARRKLMEFLDQTAPQDEVMLVSSGERPQVAHTFTSDHNSIRRAMEELAVQDLSGDFVSLQRILQPLLKSTPRPTVVLASDFANFPNNWPAALPFQPLFAGKSGENIGITRAAAQALPENPGNQALFFQIRNFSGRSVHAEIQLRNNGELIDVLETNMKPGSNFDHTRILSVNEPSKIEILLKPNDVFVLDNDFTLHALPPEKTAVRAGVKDRFLLHALSVLPSVNVRETANIRIDRIEKIGDAPAPGIFFWPQPENKSAAEIVTWNQSHPALRFVDAGLWRITAHRILDVPAGAQMLMETSEGPVAYAYDQETRRIVFGFSLENSNVYELAGFPVFLQNALDWIQAAAGPVLPIRTSQQHAREGKIQVKAGESYVNFADAVESNIAPNQVLSQSILENRTTSSQKDLSLWFLLALLAVIILEWWVFHRRIHVAV